MLVGWCRSRCPRFEHLEGDDEGESLGQEGLDFGIISCKSPTPTLGVEVTSIDIVQI